MEIIVLVRHGQHLLAVFRLKIQMYHHCRSVGFVGDGYVITVSVTHHISLKTYLWQRAKLHKIALLVSYDIEIVRDSATFSIIERKSYEAYVSRLSTCQAVYVERRKRQRCVSITAERSFSRRNHTSTDIENFTTRLHVLVSLSRNVHHLHVTCKSIPLNMKRFASLTTSEEGCCWLQSSSRNTAIPAKASTNDSSR